MTTIRLAALVIGLALAVSGVAFAADLGCAPATVLNQAPQSSPSAMVNAAAAPRPPLFHGDRFFRTELYFGSSRPGGEVTEAEFKEFLDQCVTPRFPDGLTLLTGFGQFRGSNGVIAQERSMLLILLYPVLAWRESSVLIEEIRDAYKRIFQQESVLRSDRCCEQVGF